MEKSKTILEGVTLMLKVVENMRSLADSIQEVCSFAQKHLENDVEKPVIEKSKITLEQIRGVMAEKSRAGFTAGVREIIKNHGADRLSDVDPDEYEEMITEAENLK